MSGVSTAQVKTWKQEQADAVVRVRSDLNDRIGRLGTHTNEALDAVLSYSKGVAEVGVKLGQEVDALRNALFAELAESDRRVRSLRRWLMVAGIGSTLQGLALLWWR